jgi:hypothetical protein
MKTDEILSVGRALCFGLLAPLIFINNYIRKQFMMPLFFQLILLTGYGFAISYSIVKHTTYAIYLYGIASLFITLNLLFTILHIVYPYSVKF